jgi:hypothetical protein
MVIRKSNFMWLGLASLLVTLGSCKQSGDFSGGSARPNKPLPAVSKPPVQTAPSDDCQESKLIAVKSLSSFIYQGGTTKSFDVELTFQPCPTQMTSVELPIKFDLDAYIQFISQSEKTIPYELLVNNTQQSSGRLRQTVGSDLFGKSCAACFYFLTDFPLQADPKLTKAILRLSLSSFAVRGPATSQTVATQNFTVPLHVRVGSAAPVTGQLTFTPIGL